MKVTPLEIRKKSFEKIFRGYDKDEVNAYLVSLSQAWESVQDQNKELTYKLDTAEKEILKLREIENSLFKTLKTAEDTGANMIEQANKTAELHMKETRMKADALLNESESRSRAMLEEAENSSREIVDDLQDEVKRLQDSYKKLQNQRDTLLRDIKNIADGFLEQVNQARNENDQFNIEETVKRSKKLSKATYSFETNKEDLSSNPEPVKTKLDDKVDPDAKPAIKPTEVEPSKEEGSFFDSFD